MNAELRTTELKLRSPEKVMNLKRLGAFHQTRISFVRSIIRRMGRENWQIDRTKFDLDDEGFGTTVYTVTAAAGEQYSVVIFSNYLEDSLRSDRVIAEQWDVAFALWDGIVAEADIEELRRNVPRQEIGRYNPRVLVLSRANKSVRNFENIVGNLAEGRQPDIEQLIKVGYLYRTTAVYGNGKFGLADFAKLRETDSFPWPFAAQMFTVYILRHFAIEQANYLAQIRGGEKAITLAPDIAQYLGVGNATGLGMAPFLITHPRLISQWILMRETGLARVLYQSEITDSHVNRFRELILRAQQHISEVFSDNEAQAAKNCTLHKELGELSKWAEAQSARPTLWQEAMAHAEATYYFEAQEMLVAILLELYPELVNELEQTLGLDEGNNFNPAMPLADLKKLIERRYGWALAIDFDQPNSQAVFWYRSEHKEEPRLGEVGVDEGEEQANRLGIGRSARHLYDDLCTYLTNHPTDAIAHFLMSHPTHSGLIRRMQNVADTTYGEIRANLLDRDMLPIDLLRCKLATFGASKFDPRSSLWLRITLFQGAPLLENIKNDDADDWFMPVAPKK